MATLSPVKSFAKSVAVLMLALWVPVTMHCGLESLTGSEFLSCCPHDDAESQPAHQDNDCETDSCATVESGFYKVEDDPALTPALVLAVCFLGCDFLAEPPNDSTQQFLPVSSSPPELPRFWQFSYRTALPPRAPSLVA